WTKRLQCFLRGAGILLKQLLSSVAKLLALGGILQQIKQLAGDVLWGCNSNCIALFKNAYKFAEIECVRADDNCRSVLGWLKNIVSAYWNQAAADKSNIGQ